MVFKFGCTPWNKGVPRTEEEKKNISNSLRGKTKGIKKSEKTKRKMSENHADVSGDKNPMFGKCGELSPVFGKPSWNKGIKNLHRRYKR